VRTLLPPPRPDGRRWKRGRKRGPSEEEGKGQAGDMEVGGGRKGLDRRGGEDSAKH
jgi:hypothetical protein